MYIVKINVCIEGTDHIIMNLLVSLNGSFSVTTLETSSERSNVYSVMLLTLLTPSRKTKWLVLNERLFQHCREMNALQI